MATDYVQLKNFPQTTTMPLKLILGNATDEIDRQRIPPIPNAYGRARPKVLCDWIDWLTLTCSFACLIICIIVVTPKLPYAWRLGYNNQLIVLGFMLAIMNICNRRIATRLFVIIEARWGSSTLQNFDAILRQSIFVPQTSIHWVLTFLVLTALPLGLGVAYKSFIGGYASQISTNSIAVHQYGFFHRPYPRGQNIVVKSATEAMLSFLNAASTDEVGPTYVEQPQPFGYNQLLISNGTSVVLDMPNSTLLQTIQEGLNLGESLTISADVQGTAAIYNTSTPAALKDDDMWSPFWRLHTFETYFGYRFGLSFSDYLVDAFVWLGGFQQTCGVLPAGYVCNEWYEQYKDLTEKNVEAFRSSNMTLLFNIYRQPCSATWNITSSAVTLLRGNCTDVREPNRFQNIDGNMMPTIGDVIDIYYPALYQFFLERPDSAWRVPSYAMLAATAYWARWVDYGLVTAVKDTSLNLTQDFVYDVADEKTISTRPALAAQPWLYVVLVIQPVLTTLFLLFTICFYSTPVDSGFGLTSILASINEDSLDLLHGAGLSGQLTRPLHLNLAVVQPVETEQYSMDGKIQSYIALSKDGRRAKIVAQQSYG